MDNEVHSRLVSTILRIPGINDSPMRASLLVGIPNQLGLNRDSSNAHSDISLIVSQLAEMHLSSGKWALLIFLDNALFRVQGTVLGDQLLELRQQLEAENIVKDKEQSSTDHPDNEEDHEETEKRKTQSNDTRDYLLQLAQKYRSEVIEVQQLLSQGQEPLQMICKLFKEGRGIKQDQCNLAILRVDDLKEPIQKIHKLCDTPPVSFLGDFPKLDYQVKVVLNHMDEQVGELTSELQAFRDSWLVSMIYVQLHRSDNDRKKVESDRKKIYEELVLLVETLEEIKDLLNNFLHEAINNINTAS